LRKNFKITERVKMQFQFDFFNCLTTRSYSTAPLLMQSGINLSFKHTTGESGDPTTAPYADSQGNPSTRSPNSRQPELLRSPAAEVNHLAATAQQHDERRVVRGVHHQQDL